MGKKTMTSRERVERAVRLQEPDRVPRDIWITQDAYVALRRELGLAAKVSKPWDWQNTPNAIRTGSTTWSTDTPVDLDVIEQLDLDMIRIPSYPPNGGRGFVHRPEDDLYIDEWGVPHPRAEFETGYGGAHLPIPTHPPGPGAPEGLHHQPRAPPPHTFF